MKFSNKGKVTSDDLKHNKKDQPNHHKLSYDQLKSEFQTSFACGIASSQAEMLLIKNGRNVIQQCKKNFIWQLIGYCFTGFCGVLWIASLICFLAWKPIGNPPDPTNLGLAILLIIVIVLQAAFTAFQDWSSGKIMKSIQNMMPNSATVIRDGEEKKMLASELVVGDLVMLSYGTKVPADIRLIESHDLKFDRSMLTGESEPVDGTTECTDEFFYESRNIAFMTTLITNGQGKGIVVATGHRTMMGTIADLTSSTSTKSSSLQREIRRFVFLIVGLAVSTVVILVIVWYFWLRVKYPSYIDVPTMMVNVIAVLCAFIPTGLPMAITLSLLLVARRMAKNRVLVKDLTTIETLSCVNVIASDKTGTLTQNKMFVGSASVALQDLDIRTCNRCHRSQGVNQLLAVSALCNNASFIADKQECLTNAPISYRKTKGDATDVALLRFVTESFEFENFSDKYDVITDIPFNSHNKWMMKMVKPKEESTSLHKSIFFEESNKSMLVIKGAPDILLRKCSTMVDSEGVAKPLSESERSDIIRKQNELCLKGQRVILLCKRACSMDESAVLAVAGPAEVENFIEATSDLCLIGMLGIIDPPREGISDVISKCRGAGIRVLMVTGDYALTAAAIATEIGIFTNADFDTITTMRQKYKDQLVEPESIDLSKKTGASSLLITGSDFHMLSDQDWRLITKYDEIVFARTTPEQKLTAVKEFRKDGYIVGVTGDGVNDAPALKNADIGIAMGGGSEVAMEAAQLVLLDNNFTPILIAIENGRLVFDNLRKVILYLLPAGSFAEMIPILTNMFLGVPLPLSAFQMIVICVMTDMSPALAMMLEKPEKDLLKKPPRSKKDHLVDASLIFQAYAFLGCIEAFFSHCLFFLYMNLYSNLKISDIVFAFDKWKDGYKGHTIAQLDNFMFTGQTITFIGLVIMQCFGNVFATRTNFQSFFVRPPFLNKSRNLWIFVAQLVTVVIMMLTVFLPFCHSLFNTRNVPAEFFFIPLVFALFIIVADELRKLCVRKNVLCFPKIAW